MFTAVVQENLEVNGKAELCFMETHSGSVCKSQVLMYGSALFQDLIRLKKVLAGFEATV